MVEDNEPMPSRCILVLGTGRSGTSAVGGILYKLGVWMGDGFVGRDQTNPWGTFEDAELFYVTRQMKSGIVRPEAYKALIERRNQRPLWGWKDPGLVWTLEHAMPYFDDMRAVFVHRPRGECIISARKAYNWGKEQAENWYDTTEEQVVLWAGQLADAHIATLHVAWDGVRNETKAAIKTLAEFAYEHFDEQPTSKQLKAAERHVRHGA